MLEFVSWFVLLGLFAVFQRRLCRRYPGIRTACRWAFASTLAVVVVPGIWGVLSVPTTGSESYARSVITSGWVCTRRLPCER